MALTIHWSPTANLSFEEITDDLVEGWPEPIVRKFVKQSFDCIDHIARFPKAYPIFDQKKEVRKCVINAHVNLYYRVKNQHEVELITFYSNRRKPPKFI